MTLEWPACWSCDSTKKKEHFILLVRVIFDLQLLVKHHLDLHQDPRCSLGWLELSADKAMSDKTGHQSSGSFTGKPLSKLSQGELVELSKPIVFGNHQRIFKVFSWSIGLGKAI